jgi:hypothetical protein
MKEKTTDSTANISRRKQLAKLNRIARWIHAVPDGDKTPCLLADIAMMLYVSGHEHPGCSLLPIAGDTYNAVALLTARVNELESTKNGGVE